MMRALLPVCLLLLSACGESPAKPLRVLFTGETQGRLSACICDGQLAGGLAFRQGFLASVGDEVLLLDTGNVACGPGEGERLRARSAIEAMRGMGYQAMNLGEEEAALGRQGIAELAGLGLPLVSANLVDANHQPLVAAFHSLRLGTHQVAVSGLVDPQLVARPDVLAEPMPEALARILPAFTAAAPIRILLLDGSEAQAKSLAEDFPECDLILFRGRGQSFGPILHNRSILASVYGNRYLADLQLSREAGRPPTATGTTVELTARFAADGPRVEAPAGISLHPQQLDFGRFRRGEQRQATLTVRNDSAGAVRIGRVYSPCTCFAMNVDERSIAAGSSAEIQVTLHSLDLEGDSSFPLYVAISGATEGMLSVTASARLVEGATP
jgi:hypothetical protein